VLLYCYINCTNMSAVPGDINRGCINTLFWWTSKLLNIKRSALRPLCTRSGKVKVFVYPHVISDTKDPL